MDYVKKSLQSEIDIMESVEKNKNFCKLFCAGDEYMRVLRIRIYTRW